MNEIEVTKPYETSPVFNLTVEQQNAIPLALTGATDKEIAASVGVARETVCKWRNSNPHFVAALNSERRALWNFEKDRILSLRAKALGVVDRALDAEDVSAALAIILKARIEFSADDFETDADRLLMDQCEREARGEYYEGRRLEIAKMSEQEKQRYTCGGKDIEIYFAAVQKYVERKAAPAVEPQG